MVHVEIAQVRDWQGTAFEIGPHLPIETLEVTDKSRCIEKQATFPALNKPRPYCCDLLPVVRKLNRFRHIQFRRRTSQFSNSRCVCDTRAHSGRECPSRKRYDWHSHPKRIRGSGVRPIWTTIEKQISERITSKVFRVAQFFRKYNSFRRNSEFSSSLTQPVIRLVCGRQYPEYAVRNTAQDHHPASKGAWRRLLWAVERAENERIVRKSNVCPRRALRRHNPFAIVRLITREPHHFLGKVNFVFGWNYCGIGDDIMVIGRSHRTGKPEPIYCNGSRASGEHLGAGVFSVAVEVDKNINAIRGDFCSCLIIIKTINVDPVVGCRQNQLPHGIGAIDAAVI